jgi:hypothetical protein
MEGGQRGLCLLPERLRRDMPPWLEVLLDVLGFAGFIGIATWMKAPADGKRVDR